MALKDTIKEVCKDNGWVELVQGVEAVYLNHFDKKESYDPKFESLVESNWANVLKSAEEKNIKPYFNGKIARFLGVTEAYQGIIGLNLSVTDFKHFLGMRTGTDPRIWAFCIGAIAFYQDSAKEKHFCFATRSKDTLDIGGSIETFPAGFSNVDKFGNKREHKSSEILEAEIKREFEEELGAPKETIESIKALGIAQIGNYIQPVIGRLQVFNYLALNYLLEFRTDGSKLKEYFEKNKEHSEHSEIFIVPESKLEEFIKKNKDSLVPRFKLDMIYLLERGLIR